MLSLKKQLRPLVLPIFIETALVMMLGAIDTMMLSQYSDEAVAAVGVVNQIIHIVVLVFQVISFGATVLCSQYIGAKLQERMVQATGMAILFSIFTGLILSAVLYASAYGALHLMGLRPELMGYGVSYLRIVGAFVVFQSVSLSISASLRAADKAKYPMIATVVVNVLNIFGNYVLIFGKFGMPAMGVEGAAISTSIARFANMVLLFWFLFRKHIPSFPLRLFRPFPWQELRNLLRIGLPSAGEEISYSGNQLVITYFINMLGNEALAARTYCWNLLLFILIFSISISQGGAILIGHLVGQGKTRAVYVLGKFCRNRAINISIILAIMFAIFGRYALMWLTDNEWIWEVGQIILCINIVLEIGRATNIWATAALRATGDVVYPLYVGIIFQWGVSVGLSYVFGISLGWGLIGMWTAFMLDECLRGGIFVIRWRSWKWADKGFVK